MANKVKYDLRKIHTDRAGYDRDGDCWGKGAKVWGVEMSGPCAPKTKTHAFRSENLQNARAYVRSLVERNGFVNNLDERPMAVFVRSTGVDDVASVVRVNPHG